MVRQCAPTLAGIKTGSLFPCPCSSREELLCQVRSLNRRLSPKGLCLLPLRFTSCAGISAMGWPGTFWPGRGTTAQAAGAAWPP